MESIWRGKLIANPDVRQARVRRTAHRTRKRRNSIRGGRLWASTAFGEPRFTNDVDILADFSEDSLRQFLAALSPDFYADADESLAAILRGGPFNVIYMPAAFKFDLFPARSFPLGLQELDRAISLSGTQLSNAPAPFVTPEDILLAKLHWFRSGGEASEVQWRDIEGLVRGRAKTLDRAYLEAGADTLQVRDLLNRALGPVP